MWRNTSYERAHALGDSRQPPWALWQYTQEEWQQFIAKDKARTSKIKRSRFWLILFSTSLFSIFVGTVGWTIGGFYGAICLLVVPFLWIIGIQITWWSWLSQSKIQWYDPRDVAPPNIII